MMESASGKVGIGQDLGTLPGLLTLRAGATSWLALQNEDNGTDLGTWHFTNPTERDRLKLEYVPAGGSAHTLWR